MVGPKKHFLPIIFITLIAFIFYIFHNSSLPSSITESNPNFTLKSPIPKNPNSTISPNFTFLIKVLTFNRLDSVSRCLRSLAATDYLGDRVHLHVYIDHFAPLNNSDVNLKLIESRRILDFVDGFEWKYGEKVVHYRTGNVGLQAQWLEAWWPGSDDEFAFVVEDDLEVSSLYYEFVKALIVNFYYNGSNYSPSIFGATLQRSRFVPGINAWPGKQMHSHNYRTPEPFQDQVVVLIGGAASAVDISRDVATVAKEVHIAARSIEEDKLGKLPGHDNMWLHSMIESVHEDGTVVFLDGNAVVADFIVHCTGYKFDFPFLETNGVVTVDDNRVGPLYKHVFPPALAPWLSFVGLPWKVAPFPLFELQSKWIAGVLSNRIALPSAEEMAEDIEAFYSSLEASGIPKSYTHNMSAGLTQWDYNNWIADQCGVPAMEEWRREMYMATSKNRLLRPETYRDEWDDDELVLQAEHEFANYKI